MTEQEKREKAIEEMGEIADSVYKKHFDETGEDSIETREIHEAFYDAGYRKEEEVQKETAREIVNWLIDGGEISVARNIAEEYDIEV